MPTALVLLGRGAAFFRPFTGGARSPLAGASWAVVFRPFAGALVSLDRSQLRPHMSVRRTAEGGCPYMANDLRLS